MLHPLLDDLFSDTVIHLDGTSTDIEPKLRELGEHFMWRYTQTAGEFRDVHGLILGKNE